jgi:hypothetical protein
LFNGPKPIILPKFDTPSIIKASIGPKEIVEHTTYGIFLMHIKLGKPYRSRVGHLQLGPLELHFDVIKSNNCNPFLRQYFPISGISTNNSFNLDMYTHAKMVIGTSTR